jgi:membrane fusion protein (multidrug efflux system)
MRTSIILLLALLFPATGLRAQGPAPVAVVKAAVAPVYDEVPLTGSVTTPRLSRLSPKVNGLVETLNVEEGDEVKAGDALLMLDRELAKIDLARVRAEVQEADARFREAVRQRKEAEQLFAKKHIAKSAYEAAAAEVEITAAALQRLREEARRAQQLLEWHTVYAPFDGVVARKLVEAGEWVDTGTPVFELAVIDLLRVDVPVPQYYLGQVKVGTPVRIRFDALPERYFEGRISIVVPVGSESTRTFPVRIDIDNSDRIIAPGMSARAFLQLQQAGTEQALLVPRDAIVRRPDGTASVWVLDDDGERTKAMRVEVQTGRSYRGNIEILAGNIQAGDPVVVRGNEILHEGQPVRVKEEFELNL